MSNPLYLYSVFNCVAETGSISKAAKTLYISQPAVSKLIANLEESFGMAFFTRSSRGVRLTDEGQVLYQYTKEAFDIIRQGEERVMRMKELGVGHLRIGVSATLCKYVLLPYLNRFLKEYPHVKITIESQSTLHTLKQLENNTLDIGLVAKPAHDKIFEFIPLYEIEDIFVATRDYLDNLRLREEEEDIFAAANVMLLDEENISRMYIEKYFDENNIRPQHVLEVSSMDLLIEFAKTGLGVGCVIKEFVSDELASGQLVRIPLKKPVNKREIGFCYNKATHLSDSMVKFIGFLNS
ncbi:MAG: LysR family transcriptional regulator [Clostridiales bacterium]|jgi:DNA-binding transcriptional LysR family regulator|nr:LysR family transcriptional regulator [Clostridiales bacterium]